VLEGDRGAPPEAVTEFAERGHAVVRGLASADEVEAHRSAVVQAATDHAWNRHIPPADRDTYSRAFLQATNLWQVDETVRRFVHAPRFARVAAELLGVDGVRLYHDQALVKEAHGGATPWHQDQGYWPLDTDRTITMWMPLVDLPPEVGSMTFARGSHRLGDLRGPAISDDSQVTFAQLVVERGLELDTHGPLAAGDATFHAGWTLHSAGPNPTEEDRPVMTVIYVADGTRLTVPTPQQELDLRLWAPGATPGDPLATEINPLLWPSSTPAGGGRRPRSPRPGRPRPARPGARPR
jgi:ectoine hydroxylase-related dioxygenase (phytanoyl-CoA dioxygenase family)